MQKYYSKTIGGFLSSEIHDTIPSDAVELTDDEYWALLDAQSGGKQIVADADGRPVLIDGPEPQPKPAPTKEELMAKLLEIQAQLEKM